MSASPEVVHPAAALEIPAWLKELHVIDVDSHITEAPDLWTRHAPKGYEKRLPHVEVIDGQKQWMCDGVSLGRLASHSVVMPDFSKAPGVHNFHMTLDDIHPAASQWEPRVALLDRLGIGTQIVYPNLAGFGSEKFMAITDRKVRALAVSVYNDAMMEIQECSGNRLLPMAMVPWWSVEDSVEEMRRATKMGLRGIVMCSDPQNRGIPELGSPEWSPFWTAASDLDLPINFHIGASDDSNAWFGDTPWPSQSIENKLVIGGVMMFLSNARVLANLIMAGVPDRFPALKLVSVESGLGWIPFFLEALDFQADAGNSGKRLLPHKPSEYFLKQIYSCLWFEEVAVARLLDKINVDHVMFETDFPHPVCLYPNVQQQIIKVFSDIDPVVRRKVLQDNAAKLYKIDLPVVART